MSAERGYGRNGKFTAAPYHKPLIFKDAGGRWTYRVSNLQQIGGNRNCNAAHAWCRAQNVKDGRAP